LNEWVKVVVHRQRPFVDGPFVDWSGYSFASGHTIGATLLYGQLLLFILPALKARHWRLLSIFSAVLLVALVGFSRVALGAPFLTDVLAAIVFGVLWLAFCLIAGKPLRRSVVLTPDVPLVSEPVLVRVEETQPPSQSFLSWSDAAQRRSARVRDRRIFSRALEVFRRTHESAGKNPNNCMVAWSCWSRTFH